VGRLATEKRLDLLSGVARLPGARLVIVGAGPADAATRRALPGALFLGQRYGEELASTYASLDDLKSDLIQDGTEDWRALVKSGAGEPYYDPDLMRLWAPVEIDQDLDKSSVYRRDLGARSARRQEAGWREEALGLAVARLEEIGFVVFRAEVELRKVFPRGLSGEWSNPVVGAVVAARLGYRVQLVVAIDGAGEVYTRSPDTSFTPGERRRYPPRPLTERELDLAEEIRRQRRAEGRGEMEPSDDR